MLLLNKTLLRMAKGLWRWIFLITGLKLAVLVGLAAFALAHYYGEEHPFPQDGDVFQKERL